MTNTVFMILAWAAGMLLGTVFFGGLWWTVRRTTTVRQPALWFVGSMFLRTAVVLLGFYVVSGGSWRRLLLCAVGFFMARWLVVRWTQETRYAP
jgi:F1F0 ATPase subunit 2